MSSLLSPISDMPQEILQHILLFTNSVSAQVSQRFCDAHTDLLRQNIWQIFEQCSTGQTTLNIFINDLKERYQAAAAQDDDFDWNITGLNKIHQLIVQKIQNFGIPCSNTYLSPQEIHRYAAAVEDLNLQRAWDTIRQAVITAAPAEAAPLDPPAVDAPAAVIRAWMDVNVAALQRILILDLSYRQLTCIPREIALLTGLQRLFLHDNQISELPNGIFNGLVRLQWLYLNNNQIRELPVEIFNGLVELQELFLYKNQIRKLSVEIFNKLVRLQGLLLHNNQIRELPVEIFNGLVELQRLSLDSNQIRKLPIGIFNELVGLQRLSLTDNQIRELPVGIFNRLVGLRDLYLRNNQISELPVGIFNWLVGLQGLYLDNNQIRELPVGIFNGLVGLQGLYLNNNQIRELPVEIFNELGLQWLFLSNNQIRELPVEIFNGLVGLQELYLNNNQIRELPVEIFNELGLQRLSLSNNQIKELPVEIFNGLVELQMLYLSNNQIRELPVEIFNGLVRLERLHLHDNPRLLVFYKELRSEDSNSCKNTFDAFHQYVCRSAFARFYQFAAQGHAFENVIDAFHNLDQTTKNAIYGMIYEEAGRPTTNDLQWGEHHAFDDKGIFNGALKRYVRRQFDALSEDQKNAVYGRVYELAQADQGSIHEDFSDPNWGRNHAEDNVLRLIDAMMAAAPGVLLN